jgi:peroxiredoxin
VDGDFERISLEEYLGDVVIILVFYPADFNPACTGDSTDLDGFDIFGMQPDAIVLGISSDSIYSHRAFAEAYDIRMPLLADVKAQVARAYDVEADSMDHGNRRAVFVLDPDGTVVYRWIASDINDRPDLNEVQDAFNQTGDSDIADVNYREGCEHYNDAHLMVAEAMDAYQEREWVISHSKFEDAKERLDDAIEAFEGAIRFSSDREVTASYQLGLRIVQELKRGVQAFSRSASAFANRNAEHARDLRDEGQATLEAVQTLGAPPDPDEVPVDVEETSAQVHDQFDLDFGDDESDGDLDAAVTDADAEPEPEDSATTVSDEDDIDEEDLDDLAAEIASGEDGTGEVTGDDDGDGAGEVSGDDDDIAEEDLDDLAAEIAGQDSPDDTEEMTATAGGSGGEDIDATIPDPEEGED